MRTAPPESTCTACGNRVWWIAEENRWNAADNDHSFCRASSDHKHRGDDADRATSGFAREGTSYIQRRADYRR